jgi:uncharacterized small protein (TIGR04563 family)
MSAKQKLTVYVNDEIFEEMKAEADRQDRTVSWMVEMCWRLSKHKMQTLSGVADLFDEG